MQNENVCVWWFNATVEDCCDRLAALAMLIDIANRVKIDARGE